MWHDFPADELGNRKGVNLMHKSPTTPEQKADEWRKHVRRWERSGKSQRCYCEQAGLALSTFQLWRRRLAGQCSEPASSLELVPVPWPRAGQASLFVPAQSVAVLVGDGRYRIEVADGTGAESLRMILGVLEEFLR